ncbi:MULTISPECIES: hypothetical protein [Calditerrivibrio]|uniref:Uncharacterized protein n=1 Tax=Calditerrivibrio nitroreducens TaxID=477976 RepID=A0A2J6WMK4_9BACT|nr:MAG: hypothetical protein C0187_03630 [Calditerrivibrio nitroreducens]
MNFIAPEQVVIYFIDFLFLFYGLYALKTAYQMIIHFDFHSSSALQYSLEKKNILVSNIITFFIVLNIPAFFFFLYFIDSLAPTVPGAMCAVGVLNSTPYGGYLVILKVINLFLLGYWFLINRFDLKTYGFIYTRMKYWFLIFIIVMLFFEIILEVNLFDSISPTKIVSCCGSVFGGEPKFFNNLFLDLKDSWSVLIFLLVFIAMLISYIFKKLKFYGVLSIIFLVVAIYSLIDFFSTYIYELPTHRCPFCILQKEYHYIGYLLYFLLLTGSFMGSSVFVLNKIIDYPTGLKWSKISIYLSTFYLLVVFFYVISYYFRTGRWLSG